MAVPLAVSSVLQMLFNAADMVVVGNFASEHSLAAVGSTSALVNFTVALFVGMSIGANALVSRLLGSGDEKKAHLAVETAMSLGFVSGAVLTVAGASFSRLALIWMKSPPETLELATLYMRVYSLGMIPLMVYNFGSAVLRSKGDTKRPLYYLSIAGVVNVFLNLLFVIVFKMDVAGVALATAISQGISAFLVTRCLVRESGVFKLNMRSLRLDPWAALMILRIGVPAGVQGIVFSLSNVVIQSSINDFGPIVMAGSAAAQNLEGCVWFTMNAFTHSALTFMSQNVGARKYSRLNRIAIVTCVCSALSGFVLGNVCYLFGPTLLGVFDQRPEAIEEGMVRVFYVCSFYWLCGLMDTLSGAIRGLGHNTTPTVVSLLGACGTRILWIGTLFQFPRFHTPGALFFSYPGSWALTFLVHLACYVVMRRAFGNTDGEPPRDDETEGEATAVSA